MDEPIKIILDSDRVKPDHLILRGDNMQETMQELTADRVALRKMFKAIAEYGREVRLRRQSNEGLPIQETSDGQASVHDIQPARHRKPHKKKGSN